MEQQPPPLYIVVPGRVYRRDNDATHTPQFHQVEGLAVDEDITLADLQGTLLAFAAGDLRRRPRGAPAPALLPVHRAERRARRRAASTARQGFLRDGSRCPLCKGDGLDRDPRRRRWSTRTSSSYVREYGYDPERHQGFAWGMGIERIAFLKHGVPDLRHVLRERPAAAGAVRMRLLPVSGCNDYVDPRPRPRQLAERLTMTGTEVERVYTHGVTALENFVVGRVLDAPSATRTPTGSPSARSRIGEGDDGADRLRRAQRRRRARPSPSRGPAR